jgi:sialic acid synthase SpsE
MKRFELSQSQFSRLANEAAAAGLAFVSTPLDIPSAHFLDGIVDAFKIASGDNTFYPLIETIAKTGKSIILSTGLADLVQIEFAKSMIERIWREAKQSPDLALLHCVTAYPVQTAQANLAAVRTLSRAFDCTVGYSDHTLGIRASVLAVAAGARIIEKHFTLDNNYSDFRDHQLSADPKAFKQMVQEIREVETLLGSGEKVPQPDEMASSQAIRRSIAVARTVKAGEVLGPNDLHWLRPGDGIAPGDERHVLGRRAAVDLAAGTILKPEHVR